MEEGVRGGREIAGYREKVVVDAIMLLVALTTAKSFAMH